MSRERNCKIRWRLRPQMREISHRSSDRFSWVLKICISDARRSDHSLSIELMTNTSARLTSMTWRKKVGEEVTGRNWGDSSAGRDLELFGRFQGNWGRLKREEMIIILKISLVFFIELIIVVVANLRYVSYISCISSSSSSSLTLFHSVVRISASGSFLQMYT